MARPYPKQQSDYLRSYFAELERLGLVRRNNHIHWSSPALPVRKSLNTNEFRTTVDYTRVNSLVIPLAGAMPDMETATARVSGTMYYARFDNFKDFRQLALHPDCQEQFSIVTEDGVYTPTRVPQGVTDSAIHYQNHMHTVYSPLVYDNLLVWINDIIVFAQTREEFVDKIRHFYELLRSMA
ncbi:unnamed protein product [Peronospora destructor]|uniref:Reverse transcriptase domain-containing protein n=1 Tax=Peronospora destructor TaxID=86335 RepID=A0AAV0VAZ7_9STRA|nr:unnamed protein product [Peronospora destructor]